MCRRSQTVRTWHPRYSRWNVVAPAPNEVRVCFCSAQQQVQPSAHSVVQQLPSQQSDMVFSFVLVVVVFVVVVVEQHAD